MQAFVLLVDSVITIITWIVIINIILGWLIFFEVINVYNQFVNMLYRGTAQILEPMLKPFRELQYRILPNVSGFDLSPIALVLILIFIRNLMYEYIA